MKDYKTISEAIDDMNKRGFTIDFNLGFDGVQSHKTPISLSPDRFEITEVYRFEGETSPDDAAVVYAIKSHDGLQGVLLNGYGISTDSVNDEMIKKLMIRR